MTALWGLLAAAAMAGELRVVKLPAAPIAAAPAPALAAPVVATPVLPVAPSQPAEAAVPSAPRELAPLIHAVAPAAQFEPRFSRDRQFESAFDGQARHEQERVLVEVKPLRAQAVQYMHAERPVVDYRDVPLDDDSGDFAGLLQPLVTEKAADPARPPDLSRENPELYGRSEQQLRALAEAAGMPFVDYHARLEDAYRRGLLYRLDDKGRRKTYYGVPHRARVALGLQAPEAEASASALARAKPAGRSALSRSLPELAKEAAALGDKDELFEFTAEVLNAAVREGLLERAAIPDEYWQRARRFDSASLQDALITLRDSARGFALERRVEEACEAAVSDGALGRADL